MHSTIYSIYTISVLLLTSQLLYIATCDSCLLQLYASCMKIKVAQNKTLVFCVHSSVCLQATMLPSIYQCKNE